MDKKFRNLILAQVEAVVHDKPAGRQSLYDLLKIATPDFKLHAVDNTSQRESAYKALKVLIHPDKHAKALKNDKRELHRVTKLFQETAAYYNLCCSRLGVESPGMSSNNSLGETTMRTNPRDNLNRSRHSGGKSGSRYTGHDPANITNKRDFRPPSVISLGGGSTRVPMEFDAYSTWPFMNDMVQPPMEVPSQNELAWIMGCRVINLRGGAIHGQAIGRAYQVSKKSNELDKYHSVEEVLKHFGFVCRRHLSSVQEIKMEIMEHGPVISTSFQLHKSFYQASKHADKFSAQQIGHRHPLIIVGWTMTSQGELWKVQGLQGGTFELGTGQFEISGTVLAPPDSTLETIPWQSSGPYLDLNMPNVGSMGVSSKDWRELRHMSISISAKELEVVSKLLDGGFQKAIQSKQSFVIRDKHKLAYSRRYTLREVSMGDNGKWKISVSQAEKES